MKLAMLWKSGFWSGFPVKKLTFHWSIAWPDEGSMLSGTTMVIVSVEESALSFPVRLNTYVPAAENVAVVERAFAFPNVTVPGPLTFAHVVVRV